MLIVTYADTELSCSQEIFMIICIVFMLKYCYSCLVLVTYIRLPQNKEVSFVSLFENFTSSAKLWLEYDGFWFVIDFILKIN